MVKRKKSYLFFNRCLAWHAIYLWLWIQICDPSHFDNSTFVKKSILFVTLNGGLYQNGINFFFRLVAAGHRGLSCYLQVSTRPFYCLRECDVSFHATLIGTFSKWPLIKRQKKSVENLVFPIYHLFAHLGFFNLRGIYRDKRRRKFCRQLPFKVPMTRTILFEWYSASLWHFASGQKTFTRRMNWTKFTDVVKSGKTGFQLKINTCILNTKPLSCSYKRFSDCPIHTNVVQECCWIASSVVKI